MRERVVVAMSGGVDSSVAAALLKEQAHEVIGITMCFNLAGSQRKKPSCCGLQGIEDARGVAHKLGIRHYVLNMQKALKEYVIEDFCREYQRGRTPNPCVRCNQYIKFGALLEKTFSLDAAFLATGHYARIEKARGAKPQAQNLFLKKAKDKIKDQSYFLYRLNQKQLRHALFPLGNYTKEEVRNLARQFHLPVADKLASQEICFLPVVDYRGFIRSHARTDIKPGLITDKEGNLLGRHNGIAFYTIGQREGLGIARGYPLYVIRIDPINNLIVAGERKDAYASEFTVKNPHFVCHPIKNKVALRVRIRYNHKEMPADIIPLDARIKVRFSKPEFAVTPGQSAVFYDRDRVLGGGIIDEVLG